MIGLIVERQFLGGGRLEALRPSTEICSGDGERAGWKIGVPPGEPAPKLLKWEVKEAEDNTGTGCASLLPAYVAFRP